MGYVLLGFFSAISAVGLILLGRLAGTAMTHPAEPVILAFLGLLALGGWDAFKSDEDGFVPIIGLPVALVTSCFAGGWLLSFIS